MNRRSNSTADSLNNLSKPAAWSAQATVDSRRFYILESVVSILTVITVYLIIACIIYEFKKQRIGCRSRRQKSFKKGRKTPKLFLLMRAELLVALLFLCGRFVCEHCELLLQHFEADVDFCDKLNKTKMLFSAVNVAAVYLFLWTRQRLYYLEPAMKELSNKTTRTMSTLSLFFLFIGHFVGNILFLLFRDFNLSAVGCVNNIKDETLFEYLPWIWLGTGSMVYQIILFALFIYPLIRHKSLVPSSNGFHNTISVIKRTTIATSTCIATDFISSCLIVLARDENEIVPIFSYDISATINVVCVIMSFGDWKMQLLAPFRASNNNLWNND